jgi:rhamnosyltransferase subunit B
MARVLLGWELGGGFGHAGPLLALAQALQQAGHQPVLALINLEGTRPLWEGKGIEVVAAPGFPQVSTPGAQHETLADVMVDTGVFTLERLLKLDAAWGTVFARTKPQVVVCDFAPTLALHARGRIPTIIAGSGYSMPPAGQPMPSMRFWKAGAPSSTARGREADLLATFNAAAARLGRPLYEHASDILGGDEAFICSLPELDCYGKIRTGRAIGSLSASNGPARDPARAGFFAYLAANPELANWMDGLAQSALPGEAYIRGATVTPHPAIVVHNRPVDLGVTLPGKRLVLHHGGNLAEMAMRIGLPQLLIPRTADQAITGRLLASCGVGEMIPPGIARDPRQLGGHIARIADDEAVQMASWQLAETIAARHEPPAIEVVVRAIEQYA